MMIGRQFCTIYSIGFCVALIAISSTKPVSCGLFDCFGVKSKESDTDAREAQQENSGRQSWQEIEAVKTKLELSKSGSTLNLLQEFVKISCPLNQADQLHLMVPSTSVWAGIARLMRFKLALIYPDQNQVDFKRFGDVFVEKVLKPCKKVEANLRKWSQEQRSNVNRPLFSHSDLEWLSIERICSRITLSPKDAVSEAYAVFSKQLEADYESQQKDPTWFPEKIRNFLYPTKYSRLAFLGEIVGHLIRDDRVALKTEDAREANYEIVPREALVEGVAEYLAKYGPVQDGRLVELELELKSFDESMFNKSVVKPCKAIHKLLFNWWLATFQKEGTLSRYEDEWLRVEAICKSVLAEVNSGGRLQFVGEVYTNFQAIEKRIY